LWGQRGTRLALIREVVEFVLYPAWPAILMREVENGDSAGGNLTRAAPQVEEAHQPPKTTLKGMVTFYGVVSSSGIFKSRGSGY
jgi:hypothetical protein